MIMMFGVSQGRGALGFGLGVSCIGFCDESVIYSASVPER